MAKNTPRDGEEQTNEQVNTTAKKKDPNLAERLVRDFLDAKLTGGTEGTEFYNQAKTDRCAGALEEFKAYYQERPEGSDPESAQTIDNIKKEFLYREMIRIGVTLESKRKTLSDILAREFDLPGDTHKLKKEIEGLSLDTLEKYLRDKHSRRDFIDRVFVGQNIVEHTMAEQFEKILGHKELTPNQQASMEKVFASPNIKPGDLDEVLGLFSSLEEKQLIIKFFLPAITLGDLQDAGVLSEKQVRVAIRQSIEEHHLGTDFPLDDADKDKLINDIDPQDITITTALFPGEVVDAILGTQKGKNAIRWAIEDVNKENYEAIRAESNIGLVPNDEGQLLPSFIEKLRKDLGIQNAGLFQEGNFIHGKTKLADGSMQSFYFAIDTIEDDPSARGISDRASGAVITLKNVLTADGKINTHWQKNPGEKYTYSEMFAIIQEAQGQAKKGAGQFALSTPSDMKNSITSGTVAEQTLRSDLETVDDLKKAIDEVDKQWAPHGLAEGTNIQLGKPEDADFQVFTVRSIDKKNKTVTISNGYDKGDTISFETLFDAFSTGKLTRLPKMDSPDDFLAALRTHGEKKDDFKGIIYDSKRGFIPQDKKNDPDFPSVVQFAGGKETISFFGGTDPMKTGWDKGVWTDGDTKDGKKSGKYDKDARHHSGSWNALYTHFLQTRAVPKISSVPLQAPEKTKEDMHDEGGFWSVLKGLLANPSLHDMFTGAKNLLGFVKHKLEHGSKLEAAKFQLALGKRLKFSPALMRELRTKVYASTRELMDELIKDLSALSAGDRSTEVAHILSNPRSPDYEVHAATLAMLKKHGTLYSGGTLLPYQGSFIFFKRITGQKYDPNSDLVRFLVEKLAIEGVPIREESLIQAYFKHYGGKDGGYLYDSGMWGQIRDSWREGINSEKETGGKQGEGLSTLDQRKKLFVGKLMGWEVSQAHGVMLEIWKKWGSGADMHMPAIHFVLSGIPKTLHTQQINQLYNEFFDQGHPYPALAFLKSEENSELFQRVIKKLCESSKDPGMKASYAAVEKARNGNPSEAVKAIESFWGKYGKTLHEKLVMSQDPEILYRAKTDPDFQAYVEHMKGFTENLTFNKSEVGEGVYKFHHSSTIWNATDCLKHNLKINDTSGAIHDDKESEMAWGSFVDAIKSIKDIHVTDNPDKNRAFQEERFGEYYKAFNSKLRGISPEKFRNVEEQPYMKDLVKLGFSVPKTQQESDFETPAYKAQIAEDFEAYMSGGRALGKKEKVATRASDILTQTGNDVPRGVNTSPKQHEPEKSKPWLSDRKPKKKKKDTDSSTGDGGWYGDEDKDDSKSWLWENGDGDWGDWWWD